METKYNEIVMLVHPLYDLIFLKMKIPKEIYIHQDITNDELVKYTQKLLTNPKLKHQYNQCILEYKEQLLKYKDKPNTLIILYSPVAKDSKQKIVFDFLAKNLIQSCKNSLKERFILSYKHSSDDLLLDLHQEKLANNIKLVSFGEWENDCVTEWLNKLAKRLEETRHKIKSKILFKKSLSFSGKNKGLDQCIRYRPLKRKPNFVKSIAK